MSDSGSLGRILTRQESIVPTEHKTGILLKEAALPPWHWHLRHVVLEETTLKCVHAELAHPRTEPGPRTPRTDGQPPGTRYYYSAEGITTGQLKGSMLLTNARLSNTKTPRQGKFAFRLEGNGSSWGRNEVKLRKF